MPEDFELVEMEKEIVPKPKQASQDVTEEIANDEDMLFNFVNSTRVEKRHEIETSQESLGTFSNSNYAMFGSATY